MVQANCSARRQHSIPLWTTNKCTLSTSQMRLGIVFLGKWLPLINNVVLIVSHCICACLRMCSIFCYLIWIRRKDKKLYMLPGLILLSEDWEGWFILMLGLKNGCKLILERLLLFSAFWGLRAECSKLKKHKETVNHTLKLFWTDNRSEQKVSKQSVIS